MKKKKENPVEHEEKYIEFLTKQIEYHTKQKSPKEIVEKLKAKLSKARLVHKILSTPKHK